MFIQLGRGIMILVWGIMIFNLFHPFPKPLRYFMDIAMVFTVLMHAFQLLLLKNSQPKDQKLSGFLQTKIFFFGVFELFGLAKETTKRKTTEKSNFPYPVVHLIFPSSMSDPRNYSLTFFAFDNKTLFSR